MKPLAYAALFATALYAPALAQSPIVAVEASIIGSKGEPIGTARVRGNSNATIVRLTINLGGLTPGWHGLHFHSVGDCSDPGSFELAKGHVSSADKQHGLLNPKGPHEGDLPNIYAGADGAVHAEVSAAVPLTGSAGPEGLMDADGSALIIHANEDDHVSQPIGNAGARVACAAIRWTK